LLFLSRFVGTRLVGTWKDWNGLILPRDLAVAPLTRVGFTARGGFDGNFRSREPPVVSGIGSGPGGFAAREPFVTRGSFDGGFGGSVLVSFYC
jgi:hypothetical protein